MVGRPPVLPAPQWLTAVCSMHTSCTTHAQSICVPSRAAERLMKRRASSVSTESPRQIVAQRLDEIGQDRPLAGLDERLDRHARGQHIVAKPLLLAPGSVSSGPDSTGTRMRGSSTRSAPITLTSPKISGVVRWLKADIRSSAVCPTCSWSRSWAATFTSTDEHLVARHDQHQRVPGRDDAPDRMHGQFVNDAVVRRADVDALELVERADPPLRQLGDLLGGLPQLLGHLVPQLLVDLDDLQLGLGDPPARGRDLGQQLAERAPHGRLLAPKLHDPGLRDDLLRVELLEALELLARSARWPPPGPSPGVRRPSICSCSWAMRSPSCALRPLLRLDARIEVAGLRRDHRGERRLVHALASDAATASRARPGRPARPRGGPGER